MSRLRFALGSWSHDRTRAVLDLQLATFLRDRHEQRLSKRRLEREALFAPETLESCRI